MASGKTPFALRDESSEPTAPAPPTPPLSRSSSLDAPTFVEHSDAAMDHASDGLSDSSEALHLGRSEDEAEGHQTFWDKLCALQHELSEVERKINRYSSLKEARRAGCTRNRHCWVILHQDRPTSIARRFQALLPPELASAVGKDSPVRSSVFAGRDSQSSLRNEVILSEPRRPAAAKPRTRELLPVANAPTFCLSDTQDRADREVTGPPGQPGPRLRKSMAPQNRLRASIPSAETGAVADVRRTESAITSLDSFNLAAVEIPRRDTQAEDDLGGIVRLDVDVDTPSVTLDHPSKAESSPIDKEEDVLRQLQQLAASVKPADASESSSESSVQEPRQPSQPSRVAAVAQDPRGHGSMPAPRAQAEPVAETFFDLPAQRESLQVDDQDVLEILQQLEGHSDDSHADGLPSAGNEDEEDSLEMAEEEEEEEDEEEEEESESKASDVALEAKNTKRDRRLTAGL